MSRRAYRATGVNEVNWEQIALGKEGLGVTLGVDVGKFDVLVVCRWADERFERPWRVKNPREIHTRGAGQTRAGGSEVSGRHGVVGNLWQCPTIGNQ
jgi:hypothetical protein